MAEEPQPSTVVEGDTTTSAVPAGAATDAAEGDDRKPTNAEDRKAAAALSALDQRGDDVEDDGRARSKDVADALGAAMKRLDVGASGAGGSGAAGKVGKAGKGEAPAEKKGEAPAAARKVVKVDPADVGLLVEQLEVTKSKATEMLKAHEGDAVKAMVAFVTAEV